MVHFIVKPLVVNRTCFDKKKVKYLSFMSLCEKVCLCGSTVKYHTTYFFGDILRIICLNYFR